MKKSRRALAASFVVTVAALPNAACKKTSDGEDPPRGNETASVYRNDPMGGCRYSTPEHCPKGASCNPPPPREVDCPPNLRDAGDPPAIARRPPGKEDWVRMRPGIWPNDPNCSVSTEYFCAPPGKPISCTNAPTPPAKIACTKIEADGGITGYKVSSFVWQDGVGGCHKTQPIECAVNKRCDLPEGETVPCL